MTEYHNPAGRLYALLTQFGERAGARTQSRQAAWAGVLGVKEDELPFHLGNVVTLLDDVRLAATNTGRAAFAGTPDHLRVLAHAVLPAEVGLNSRAEPPDRTAMEMLAALSAYLEDVMPDGELPKAGVLDALREQVRQLLDDVSRAQDLPPEVKRALHQRLAEVLEALDHLRLGGPDAVARAAEALAAVATLVEDDAAGEDKILVDRIKLFARSAWVAVQVFAVVTSGALNWDKIVDEKALGPGQEIRQIGPPRIPLDPSHDPDAGGSGPNEALPK